MGPKPASAAAGGARSTPGTQQQPSRAVKELQAGLPLVQQPYNEAACVAVMHHMDAAIPPSVDPLAAMRKVIQQQPGGDAGPVLELLNKYWQWFQSGVMQPVAPASSSTATGPSRTGIRSRRSLIMVSGGSSSSRRDIGMEFVCHHLNEVYNFLSAYYDAVKAGEVQAAGIRSQLLASGTGTFALLGRTAELVMQYPAKQVQQQIGRYTDLIGAWFRAHELAGTLSFNSSNSSSKTNLWAEAPAMAQALPAVAHLMHAYFQQPPKARLCVSYDLYYFGALLQQLLLLVDGAVTKPGQGPCTGSSSSSSTGRSRVASSSATATQQLEEQQAPASQEPQPPLPPQPACILVDETVFPQSSRARVERVLWHILATATAALNSLHPANPSKRTTTTSTPSSSSGSSRSSGNGIPSTPGSPSCALPPGAAYQVPLLSEAAMRISRKAGMALLQLAMAGVPPDQQMMAAQAADWMQDSRRGGSSAQVPHKLSEGLNMVINTPDAGMSAQPAYLSWPYAPSSTTSAAPDVEDAASSSNSRRRSSRSTAASSTLGAGASGSSSRRGATPTTGRTTTSRSTTTTSSSSSKAGTLDSVKPRLQLLAASTCTWWRIVQQRLGLEQNQRLLRLGLPAMAVAVLAQALGHSVLLMAQQLQRVPSRHRAAFLHSPAGNSVLQVLSELSAGQGVEVAFCELALGERHRDPREVQREEQAAAGDWTPAILPGRLLVQQLLVPGLLLHPTPAEGCSSTSRQNVSTSSSSHAAGSSGEGASGQVANCASQLPTPVDTSGCSCPVMPALGVRSHGEDKLVPLDLVPCSALQLPPGCTPPPAAFFVVEQLTRGEPSPGLQVAIQLLRGSMPLLLAGRSHPPGSREEALAELQRLAYCSLASSVVHTVMDTKGSLAAHFALDMLQLAGELVATAEKEAAALHGCSSSSSGGGSTKTSSSGSRNGRMWGLAASLAAWATAGGFTAHVHAAQCCGACTNRPWPPAGSSSGQVNVAGAQPAIATASTGSSSGGGTTTTTTSSSSSGSSAPSAAAPATAATAGLQQISCHVCLHARDLLSALLKLEQRAAFPAPSWATNVAASAQQRLTHHDTSPEGQLERAMLQLAWRRPVPGVCGNIQCDRKEQAAAAGLVKGRRGTLCGGCKAAWYCCKACQREAWVGHEAACGDSD